MAESPGQDDGAALSESSAKSPQSFSMRTTVYGIKKRFPSVQHVSCHELEQWRQQENQKIICLDTRAAEEYSVSHLSGSVRVDPEGELDLKELNIDTDSTVVCYCSVGYRSSLVAQRLFRAHKQATDNATRPLKVYNLEGGVFQWACEGRGLVNPQGETVAQVHPYSTMWSMLLPHNLRHKM